MENSNMLEKKLENGEESNSLASSGDENKERGNWTGKLDFLLSCLSYAVGLGNLWRFPYLCYRNGGGAFLIPYIIMLTFAGVPLFFMELSFGQFASEGVISIWKVCPLFQGIGWGMFIVSGFIMMYYNMVIAWTLFYLFASLRHDVPWRGCDNHWNSPLCSDILHKAINNCSGHNGTWYNQTCYLPANANISVHSNQTFYQFVSADVMDGINDLAKNYSITEEYKGLKSPSDEYFHNYVLDISEGFHDLGPVRWQLALCLMGAWILVGICLCKGIKSSGKAVYFTATFPYLVLCILLVRCLTLKGAYNGIVYYLTPQWHRLASAKVWGDAAVQIFFSLSPCWGGLIVLASYNRFHNNCLRDSLVVSIGNCATSVFAGFVIFGIIGFMAEEMKLPIEDVAKGGAGLAFIVYPEVVKRLPISPLWSILFFMMLITLGLGTQFATVTTVHTTLLDVFPGKLRQGKRPLMLMCVICCVGFLLGLSCCTRGGMYMLQMIDNYAATYSVLLIGLCEILAISYIYGVKNFLKDIEMMIGYKTKTYWWWYIMWRFVSPALLVFIMIFTWVDFRRSKYGDHLYPIWADVMGWLMSMTSVSAIPIVAIYKIVRHKKGSIWETIKALSKPTEEWGPASERNKKVAETHEAQIPLNYTPPQTPEYQEVVKNGNIYPKIDSEKDSTL